MTGRRRFLETILGVATALAIRRASGAPASGEAMTVLGPVPAGELGTTLCHEHVLVDFIGADAISPDRYQRDDVVRVVLPHLERVASAGCQTLVEATPAFLGRDPLLLKELSKRSGLHILTNTGFYGARGNRYIPSHLQGQSAEALAQRWLQEWHSGIEETSVRPGFLKLGVDSGSLTPLHRELIRGAALTHLESGLVIAVHTGDGQAAREQLEILRYEGVSPEAWIWVHAQNEPDSRVHLEIASEGGWVAFDGVRRETVEEALGFLRIMKERGLLGRTLISQDAGWYSVGEVEGGAFSPYEFLFESFLPALQAQGLDEAEIGQVLVANPAQAFTVQVRRR